MSSATKSDEHIELELTADFTTSESDEAQEAALQDSEDKENYVSPYGKTYTKNMWYFAVAGHKLKRGQTVGKQILDQPVLVGRDRQGNVFAMRDICPHQAVPLSAGHFDGKEVECAFHGWRFDTSGVCTAVPSLCSDQKMNLCGIKTRSYQCREVMGSVWVYIGDSEQAELPEVPHAPGLDGFKLGQTTTTLLLPTHIDYAVAALIDTAHVPYVHTSWWWRSKKALKEKSKKYVPSGTGWTMVKHQPSKHSIVFKLIGQYLETEISFRLPGCRREYITLFDRTIISGITTLTPIDDKHTELNHTTYWTVPGITWLVAPIVGYFVKTFLMQDQTLALLQEQVINKYNPRLIMTIKDAGTPGHWYFMCKKEWNDAYVQGRQFVNPIKEKILRWRT